MIRIRVAGFLLVAFATTTFANVVSDDAALTANSSVSAAATLPGDQGVAAARGKQENVQVAKGSDTFLAVWSDTRSALAGDGTISVGGAGPYFGPGLGTMSDIYAARLDSSGNVIDQHPIVVSQGSYNQGKAQVAWNGENWLVVWLQEQETNYPFYEIRGVRISSTGAVLDATPITISPATQNLGSWPAAVVSEGPNWVVIWEGIAANQSTRAVYARRISAAGALVEAEPLAIYTHSSQNLTNPDLAYNGSVFLLTFRDLVDQKIYGQRYTPTLQPTGARFTINNFSPSKPTHVQVAANPDGFFVVWDEHPASGNIGSLNGCRITSTGTVQDPNSITIDSNVGTSETMPNAVWDGTRWAIAYNSEYWAPTNTYGQQDIYLKRVAASNGAVSPSTPIRVTTATSHQTKPAIAPGTTSGAVQVIWDDARVEQDIYTAQVASNGTVSNERAASLGAPRQNSARMAFGGNVVLTVFERRIAGSAHIYAQRLDTSGNAIDAQPFQLSADANAANSSPSVAFNGTNFFVVWHQPQTDELGNITRRVYGRRVAPGGTLVDGAPFLVMEGETADVAALGENFLVVAIRRQGTQVRNVESVRVSGAGAVLGNQAILLGNYNFAPRVAALGNRWLVVWQYHSRHDASTSWIRASFVDAAGAATASFQIATSDYPYTTGNSYDDTPHLAVSGNEALIVWADNDNNTNDIKGRRIDANGTLLGSHYGFLISNASGSQFIPAVTWDGSQYVATWLDQRNEQYPVQPRGDIYGTRITEDGTVLDPSGFVVANSAAPEETPFVAAANGSTLFSWSGFYSGAPFSAMRVAIARSNFKPASVLSAIALPSNAPRGSWLTGSVTLTGAAPAGGTMVSLQSADPAILSVPTEVTVPEGATSATFAARTHAVSADTQIVVSATSAASTRTATVVVTATSTFPQWQQVHFNQDANVAANSAATADPDRDGRSNLVEYAMASNPTAADSAPASNFGFDGTHMSLSYTRRIGATDLAFSVNQSSNLGGWTPATTVDTVSGSDGVTETVTSKVPVNGAAQMFLRLQITQQ